MRPKQYVITGINVLTRAREELSRPMEQQEAQERLERELANRKYQRYATHKRLRIEPRLPTQLNLLFQNDDHE
jgi:hypothetical protein